VNTRPKFSIHYLIAAVLLAPAVNMFIEGLRTAAALIDYSDFKELVRGGHVEGASIGSTGSCSSCPPKTAIS
jgi:hypothetical protein